MENREINGWDFEFVNQNEGNDQFYQCRGEVMYDDDHDETPEPSLFDSEACHSEKGWVEVNVKK